MELDDLKDSIKAWFDDKLKNPYFASVLAVWLITNRVVVFGLFNFNENQNLQERVSWVHQQLQHNKVYPLKIFGSEMFPFEGFYPIVGYSFLLGLLTMVVFRYINVIGKGFYAILGKGANSLNKMIKPEKWRPIEEVINLQKQITKLEATLEKNQKDYREVKQDNEVGIVTIAKLTGEKADLEKEKAALVENSRNYSKILEENNKYKSKFPSYNVYEDNEDDSFISYGSEKYKRVQEIKNFIKSEYANYFDEIYSAVVNHKPIGGNVPEYYRDYYVTNKLISLKDNLYVLTPLGEEYYNEYLKTKNYPVNNKNNSNDVIKYIQNNTKPASISDYKTWINGYKEQGNKISNGKKEITNKLRLIEKDISIPALHGANAFEFIVSKGVNVVFSDANIGHSKIYYLDGFRYDGNGSPQDV